MQVYSDYSGRFIRYRQCLQEVEAGLYHYWVLKYPLKCASAGPSGAPSSEYFNIQYASMLKCSTSNLSILACSRATQIAFVRKIFTNLNNFSHGMDEWVISVSQVRHLEMFGCDRMTSEYPNYGRVWQSIKEKDNTGQCNQP